MKYDIKLPPEFISGNSIPVTVATIKRERMEEILHDAIEQAVLESLPTQTSSTIRGDSYAGVYIWLGSANITHHIPKLLMENAKYSQNMLECVAAECMRDLEQTVLQSEQVQKWKQDSERYQWLKKQFRVMSLDMGGNHSWVLQRPLQKGCSIDEVCDASMERKNES